MNIIELAEEAGLAFNFDDYPDIWMTHMNVGREEIERFANLVAAAARADEREECAKACEEVGQWPSLGPKDCAYAIRERGTT